MSIKLKTFENIEKYWDCLTQLIEMLSLQHSIKAGLKTTKKITEPEITPSNQFQILHLFALFGLNDKKEKLTDFIQNNITSRNLFNYLLWISDYIQAGLQDAYVEEIKYWYWLIVYILMRKHTNGKHHHSQ